MSDIGTLTAAASKAQAALTAAQAEQAALAASAAEDRKQRSIQWAFATIVAYPGKLAAESPKVDAALAAFSTAVESDYGQAPARYLDIIRAMAAGNGAAAELTQARNLLREASILPPFQPNRPDPTGQAAPYPMIGVSAFPTFEALVESTVAAARAVAVRTPPSAEYPGAYTGTASEAMKHDVLASEFVPTEEFEILAGLQAQAPERFDRLPAEQKAATAAYLACREARGYDAKLPKIAHQVPRESSAPHFAPDETARFTLYGQPEPSGSALEPSHPAVRRGI